MSASSKTSRTFSLKGKVRRKLRSSSWLPASVMPKIAVCRGIAVSVSCCRSQGGGPSTSAAGTNPRQSPARSTAGSLE